MKLQQPKPVQFPRILRRQSQDLTLAMTAVTILHMTAGPTIGRMIDGVITNMMTGGTIGTLIVTTEIDGQITEDRMIGGTTIDGLMTEDWMTDD